jgi:hypothetical protein
MPDTPNADRSDTNEMLAVEGPLAVDALEVRRDELAGSKKNTFLFLKTTPIANANVQKIRHLLCGGNTYANIDQTEGYCEHCNMKGPIFVPEKPEDAAKLMEEIIQEDVPDETGLGADGTILPADPAAPPPPQVKPLGTRPGRLPSLNQVLRERKETMTGEGQGTGEEDEVNRVAPPKGPEGEGPGGPGAGMNKE